MQDVTHLSNVVVPLTALGGVLFAGALYGRMNTKIEEAHTRIDRVEDARAKRDSVIDKKLDDITTLLTDMRVMMSHRRKNDSHEEE